MAQSLAGKVVFVTGASAGIGAACARGFAELGARLVLLARRRDRLQALVPELREAGAAEVHTLPADVRDFDAVAGAYESLPSGLREVEVLVNNAGLSRGLDPVQSGKLDMGLGIFKSVPGIRRIPFFRFSLVLVRPPQEAAGPRATTAWGTLDGQSLIALSADNPLQQLIDRELAGAGIACPKDAVVNLLDTQIALVEAGQGMAIIPSFGLAVTRHRQVSVSQLVPAVHLDYHQITRRARQPSPAATEFASFLKGHMARWAGTAGGA